MFYDRLPELATDLTGLRLDENPESRLIKFDSILKLRCLTICEIKIKFENPFDLTVKLFARLKKLFRFMLKEKDGDTFFFSRYGARYHLNRYHGDTSVNVISKESIDFNELVSHCVNLKSGTGGRKTRRQAKLSLDPAWSKGI